MFDEPIRKVMGRRKLLKGPPDMLVVKAARLMAARNVGAIVVVEGERLVGIFTERDVVFRVVAMGLDPRTTRVAEVMTRDPQTVHPDRPFGHALVVMHDGGFRHLPVVLDGKPVGIVSARSAMDPDLQEFSFEIRRTRHYRALR